MFLDAYDFVDVRDSSSSDVEVVMVLPVDGADWAAADPAEPVVGADRAAAAAAMALPVDGADRAADHVDGAGGGRGGRHRFSNRLGRSRLEHMCIAARMREKKAHKSHNTQQTVAEVACGQVEADKKTWSPQHSEGGSRIGRDRDGHAASGS